MPTPDQTSDIVDPSTGVILPGVLTFEQAHATYRSFVTDNRERNRKNTAIARKLNNEQPWNPKKLKAAGQSWRSNRPTGFMSSLIKRITPPYKQVVDQVPLLTYSRFPTTDTASEPLVDVFRREITNCIRNWVGWPDFVSQLVDENLTYGYAAVGPRDEFDWHPRMYRSDEAMFPVGCSQNVAEVRIWALREDFYVDDIVEKLREPDIARQAGWHVNNLIEKLNKSERQHNDRGDEDNVRRYEDLIRENNISASFTSSVRVVKAGHLFVESPEGGVDHYIMDRDDGKPLFFRRRRYIKMEECLALFTAEVGDRTLHGSRGAGRALYNTHVSVEQARNLINDALHLSGLVILRRKTAQGTGSSETPALSVNHPFAIIGTDYEVLEKVKFEIDSESFFALDRHATMQAEIQVGAFMPGQILDQQGQRRTASEVNYTASIDAQIRAGMLARFADQMFLLIDQIQRRICNKHVLRCASDILAQATQSNAKPVFNETEWQALSELPEAAKSYFFPRIPPYCNADAVSAVYAMLKQGLTVDQVAVLANSPSRASVDDAIAAQSGVLDAVVARYVADPVVDTVELKRRDIASKIGSNAAQRLMNVDLNPLSAVKQQRLQTMELSSISDGLPIPVDPTDDDVVHLKVILSRIQPFLGAEGEAPLESTRQLLASVLQHADAHVESAIKKGAKPASLGEITSLLDEVRKMIAQPATDQRAASALQGSLPPGAVVPSAGAPTPPPVPSPSAASTVESLATPPRPKPPTGGAVPGAIA